MKTQIYSLLFFLILCTVLNSQTNKSEISKVNTNDNFNFISVNQIKMWISNTGEGSHNPLSNNSGFYWPGGLDAVQAGVFQDGLVWGCKVNGETRVNGNTHRGGLQAGKILPNGIPDDPSLPKYRVYKILNGWENLPPGPIRDRYETDYNEWPVEDGAPWVDVNGDGTYTPGIDKPKYVGDETLWYVANDMDPSRSVYTYGSNPIGLEFQTTIYAFDSTNFLADVIFKKYRIINKSTEVIDNLFICYWSDDDVGEAFDDFVGSDPYYHLGYAYNSDNIDGNGTGLTYGTPPPAVGHMFVQGPISPALPNDSAYINNEWRKGFRNLPLSSFAFYHTPSQVYKDPPMGLYSGTLEFYNIMQGLRWNGQPYVNPLNNEPTLFPLSGDPEANIGWYEGPGWPGGTTVGGDRRSVINSGPVTLAAGDTQEVVIAIFMAKGTNNLNSISELKQRAEQIQNFFGAFVPNIVSVDDALTITPNEFNLMQNYPNPFNPTTKISWHSPVSSHQTLKVFDLLGNEIATLVNEERPAGSYEIEFDATNLSSGVYFYKLQAGSFVQTRKMILVK